MGFLETPVRAETQTKVQRIHIIGGPGSGKSTLARMLGQCMCLPVYDLDKIAFDGKDFVERPLPLRLREAHEIARQTRWVSEGIFVGWVDELLCNADVIVWLDTVPWRGAIWRIVIRFARNGWREMRRQRGVNKFGRVQDYRRNLGQLYGVIFSSRAYYDNAAPPIDGDIRNVTHAQTADYLADYMHKVIHIRSRHELEDFISELSKQAMSFKKSFVPNSVYENMELK